MGAGYHGGFGETIGCRNRIGFPIPVTERNYDMMLNPTLYVNKISKKYNIHLKGSGNKIDIIYDPNMKHGVFGKVYESNPYVIHIGPDAMISEVELANTIAHELNHARSYIKGGRAPEKSAYKSGNTLEEYIRGER